MILFLITCKEQPALCKFLRNSDTSATLKPKQSTTTADLEIVSYAFHLVNGIDPTAFVTYLDSIYGTVNVGAEAFSQGE